MNVPEQTICSYLLTLHIYLLISKTKSLLNGTLHYQDDIMVYRFYLNILHYINFSNNIQALLVVQAIDDPSSNQFRDPPTYTHQPSMQQKVPFSLIRCSSSKVAFCSCVE